MEGGRKRGREKGREGGRLVFYCTATCVVSYNSPYPFIHSSSSQFKLNNYC